MFWPRHAPWVGEWEAELLLFPNARHDDQVDTLSYAALEVAKRRVDLSGPWPVGDLSRISPNRV